jgi:hypothetical protein
MTITYRTDGDWGTGKGGNLTPAEVDENFWWLFQAIDEMESPAPAEIDNITLTGTQLTITLEDSRSWTVTVPRAAFRWRGTWAPATSYAGNDVFEVMGAGLYLTRIAHTSDSTFDATRTIDSVPVYQLMFREPRAQVITESGSTYDPALADGFGYVRCTNAAGCTVTIPANADVGFAVGTELHFRQAAAGAVTIAGDSGVTVNVPDGFLAETDREGAVVTAKKVAANAWDLFGLLAEDTA